MNGWMVVAEIKCAVALVICSMGMFGCTEEPIAVAIYESAGTGGDSAELAGSVETAGGCLYLDASGELFLPVFPREQVRVRGGSVSVNGAEVHDGDTMRVRGSEKSLFSIQRVARGIPTTCTDARRFWLVASDR